MRNRSRPVQRLPRTRLETLLEILTVLGIIVVVALTIWGWQVLPAIIPTHYGPSGAPNAYGGKGSLLILPILSICLAILLTLLGRFPQLYNYPWPITAENASRQYALVRLLLHWLALEIVWMLCAVQWSLIQAAQGGTGNMILFVVLALVAVILVTIIVYLVTAARAR